MFYIHGSISLTGDWPEDLACAIESMFMTDGFRKIFGRDAVTSDSGNHTYIIMGHGSLVLSDLLNASDLLMSKYQSRHVRSYECLVRGMYAHDLRISVNLSAQDMQMLTMNVSYNCDALIYSDGSDFVVTICGDSDSELSDSLVGYGLMRLGETVFRRLYDADIASMAPNMRAFVRCMLYLNVLSGDFFDSLLHMMWSMSWSSQTDTFEDVLQTYLSDFVDGHVSEIRACLSDIVPVLEHN